MYWRDADGANAAAPDVPPIRNPPVYNKIMVVGQSGLGKTSLCHNLVASLMNSTQTHASEGSQQAGKDGPLSASELTPQADNNSGASEMTQPEAAPAPSVVTNLKHEDHTGEATSIEDFEQHPWSLVLGLPIPKEATRTLHLKLQDTPGYGDDVNIKVYLRRIIRHILRGFHQDYEELRGRRKLEDPGLMLQHSVTSCVFLVSPHRLTAMDLLIMCVISQLVPIIPVISRADTIMATELEDFKKEVQRKITNARIYLNQVADSCDPGRLRHCGQGGGQG